MGCPSRRIPSGRSGAARAPRRGVERHGGVNDGALAFGLRLVDQPLRQVDVDGFERFRPVAGRRVMFEHRLARPRQRRDAIGFHRVGVRGLAVAAPPRLPSLTNVMCNAAGLRPVNSAARDGVQRGDAVAALRAEAEAAPPPKEGNRMIPPTLRDPLARVSFEADASIGAARASRPRSTSITTSNAPG